MIRTTVRNNTTGEQQVVIGVTLDELGACINGRPLVAPAQGGHPAVILLAGTDAEILSVLRRQYGAEAMLREAPPLTGITASVIIDDPTGPPPTSGQRAAGRGSRYPRIKTMHRLPTRGRGSNSRCVLCHGAASLEVHVQVDHFRGNDVVAKTCRACGKPRNAEAILAAEELRRRAAKAGGAS